MQPDIELGERIACWREHRGLTQAALADKLDLTPAAIGLWETGDTSPTQSNLQRLVDVLELTMSQFWGRTPARKKKREAKAS